MNKRRVWGKDFGINLQRMLHRKGVTQVYLANAIGVTEPMFSRYVNGTAIPSAYKICQMAELIGCDVSDLVKTEYDI